MQSSATATRNGGKKRSRNTTTATDDSERPTKPPPRPPKPPAALIKLLKANKSCLRYFTALQSSLDYDVQKWKQRAKFLESQVKDLQEKLRDAKSEEQHENIIARQSGNDKKDTIERGIETDLETDLELEDQAPSRQAPLVGLSATQGVAPPSAENEEPSTIDVEVKLSSDEDELERNDEDDKKGDDAEDDDEMEDAFAAALEDNSSTSSTEEQNQVDSNSHHKQNEGGWDSKSINIHEDDGVEAIKEQPVDLHRRRLLEVLKVFDELQIRLVDETATAVEQTVEQEKMAEDEEIEDMVKTKTRRSDVEVVADLLDAIKSSVKSTEHQPFVRVDTDFAPCGRNPEHKAHEVKQKILRLLLLVDAYCGEDVVFSEDSENVADCDTALSLSGRRAMIGELIQTLHHEIAFNWAMVRRSARIDNQAIHFDTSDSDSIMTPQEAEKISELSLVKSGNHLSTLAEQCILVELVSSFYLFKGMDSQFMDLVMNYLTSTAPALEIEDYPLYPPAQSICILDTMVMVACSAITQTMPEKQRQQRLVPKLLRVSRLSAEKSFAIWKQRCRSKEDRIRDVALVECSAYSRLLARIGRNVEALQEQPESDQRDLSKSSELRQSKFEDSQILISSIHSATYHSVSKDIMGLLEADSTQASSLHLNGRFETLHRFLVSKFRTLTEMSLRQLDDFRSQTRDEQATDLPLYSDAFTRMGAILPDLSESEKKSGAIARCFLECAALCADGFAVINLLSFQSLVQSSTISDQELRRRVTHSVLGISSMPLVRVINLQRRKDRWRTMRVQCQKEKVLLIKGVVKFEKGAKQEYFGHQAYDGIGSLEEAMKRMTKESGIQVGTYVAEKWRPSDLKAFDRNARDVDVSVALFPSEIACALSHVASWEGVRRSLESFLITEETDMLNVRHVPRLLKQAHLAGYARGQALFASNERMNPQPVCLVVEDDAIFVDSFAERLNEILSDLPRDFHFCSLGYSRPKTAPMVSFSEHLGIPTCTWYLTGYLLSLDGAKELLKSCPVVGPVDSWIGLKMTANWDNIHGQRLGVGIHSKPMDYLPTKKDLGQILRFRAFAALNPLCSQKLSKNSTTWRQRDTDIQYSGHIARF